MALPFRTPTHDGHLAMNKLLLSLVTLFLACASSSSFAQGTIGSASAGAKKINLCLGCHGLVGYQASFPEIYKVPKLSGQGAGYIASALTAYKNGERKHPTMRGLASTLSEQDIADLAAYFESNGRVEAAVAPGKAADGSSAVVELVKKGGCTSCHGESFSKPIDPSFPKIAGQHADYLFAALKAYKTEGNPLVVRANPVMGAIAKQFSNSELKELASYVSALPGELKTVPESNFKLFK